MNNTVDEIAITAAELAQDPPGVVAFKDAVMTTVGDIQMLRGHDQSGWESQRQLDFALVWRGLCHFVVEIRQ